MLKLMPIFNLETYFRMLLLCAVFVITYLATTSSEITIIESMWDKLNHLVAFFVLALLLDFSFPKRRFELTNILVLLSYGFAIEIIQWQLSYRSFSLYDVVADFIGVLVYILVIPLITRTQFACWRRG